MKSRSLIVSIFVVLLFLCVGSIRAGVRMPYGIALRVTGGIVVGETADLFPEFYQRSFYGLGCSFEYRVSYRFTLGANVETVWKDMSVYNGDAVLIASMSGSVLYRLSRNQKRSPMVRVEYGVVPGSWIKSSPGGEPKYDSFPFIRAGLGVVGRSGSHTSTRFELYYKRVFTEGRKITGIGHQLSEHDTNGVGIEFAFIFHP